jgi:hypothetical protein
MILAKLIASNDKCIESLDDLADYAEDVMPIFAEHSNDIPYIMDETSMAKRRIFWSITNKHGIDNCFLSTREKFSDKSMELTLAGKRVVFEMKYFLKLNLADRVKRKKSCGFHIGQRLDETRFCMLYNKRFDQSMRRKIDHK